MDREFELKGKKFKLRKIHAIKQVHIVRRLAPLMADVIPAVSAAVKDKGGVKAIESFTQDEQVEFFGKIAQPVLAGFSKLSDEDAEIVLYGLLEAVEVQQQAGNWAQISNGKLLMIDDFELPVMLNLSGRAFMYNLSSFFPGLLQ